MNNAEEKQRLISVFSLPCRVPHSPDVPLQEPGSSSKGTCSNKQIGQLENQGKWRICRDERQLLLWLHLRPA